MTACRGGTLRALDIGRFTDRTPEGRQPIKDRKAYLKEYYARNKDRIRQCKAEWYQSNKSRISEHQRQYWVEHPDKAAEKSARRRKKRSAGKPEGMISAAEGPVQATEKKCTSGKKSAAARPRKALRPRKKHFPGHVLDYYREEVAKYGFPPVEDAGMMPPEEILVLRELGWSG